MDGTVLSILQANSWVDIYQHWSVLTRSSYFVLPVHALQLSNNYRHITDSLIKKKKQF